VSESKTPWHGRVKTAVTHITIEKAWCDIKTRHISKWVDFAYFPYLLLLIWLLCARCLDGDNAVAGDDAHSHIWAVSGSSDAIDPPYGLIDIVRLLGYRGGNGEGSRNMGDAEAIWGVDTGWFAALIGTVGRGGQIRHPPPSLLRSHGCCRWEGARFWSGARGGGEKVPMVLVVIRTLGWPQFFDVGCLRPYFSVKKYGGGMMLVC
jgi:hypothetical protein